MTDGRHRLPVGPRRSFALPLSLLLIAAGVLVWATLLVLDPGIGQPAAPAVAFLLVVAVYGILDRD
jgi:hypothetical protein